MVDADSYVVRVYRRNKRRPRQLIGVVEAENAKSVQAFRNAAELLQILATTPSNKKRSRR